MSETTRRSSSEVTGVHIGSEGVVASITWGRDATTRGAGGVEDGVAKAIDGTDGIRIVDTAVLDDMHLVAAPRRSRSGGRQLTAAKLTVDLGEAQPEERRVVLVQEGGSYSWFIPRPGEDEVDLPVEVATGTRNVLTKALRRVVRVVAVKTVGWALHQATGTIVGGWDERKHPPRVRTWGATDFRDENASAPDLSGMDAGPGLLVIHGFAGSIHGTFGALHQDVVGTISAAYGGRTLAYDHPTLVATLVENAAFLRERLLEAGKPMELDVLAHSRGGLVARELLHQLKDTNITIRSLNFVATPNDGTPLADPERPMGLLDALTNLVGAVPGSDAVTFALELLKDVVVKSGLSALAGLTAMDPDGDVLRALNDRRQPAGVELRAIAADFEPMSDAGIVRTARNRLIDTYFGSARNDLIVPTLSTIVTRGQFGVPVGQRLVLDSSRGVDHSTFWTNPRATRQLVDWLRADVREKAPALVPIDEAEPRAEVALPPDPMTLGSLADAVQKLPQRGKAALESLVGGPIDPNATPPTGDRHAVVVVPGIMGTHLSVGDRGVVWLDPIRLMRGHFQDLKLAGDGSGEAVTLAGLNRTYLPLITRLAANFDVYLAGFDWRRDIRESSELLAGRLRDELLGEPTRKVTLVAHSMGGLVSRTLPIVAPDVWEQMRSDARVGREAPHPLLVMLGTPNRGSYATVLTLTGSETILKGLAAVDLGNDLDVLGEVVASFPGVYQMLPSPTAGPDDDHHANLYNEAGWGTAARLPATLLAAAKAFHVDLEAVHDPDRLVYVAGYGRPTPYRVELTSTGDLRLGVFSRGDGRVPIPLGVLEAVEKTYYSPATHGGLPSDPDVLESLGDLVRTGLAPKLEKAEPVRRGDVALEVPPMMPVADFDELPLIGSRAAGEMVEWRQAEIQLDAALTQSLGGGEWTSGGVAVEVGVLHASLEMSADAIAVGHYSGLPQGGAELFLDAKLNGALRNRQRLGGYPEEAGTALFVPAPRSQRPRGAIVLGLGAYGSLTPAILCEAMTQGIVDMVLAVSEIEPDGEVPAEWGLASVLVGTPGRHGLTIDGAVTALTEGALLAVQRLRELDRPIAVERIRLQIVEMYEQNAEDAAQVVRRLRDLVDPDLARGADLITAERLDRADGARPGAAPRGVSGTPWVRIAVGLEDEGPRERRPADAEALTSTADIRTMTLTTAARGAQANLIRHDVDLTKIRAYVDRAVRRDDAAWSSVSRTLYEMLFPVRAKLDLDRADSLHLLVDDALAEVPWELLAAPTIGRDASPLALRAGMLRQLRTDDLTRERSKAPTGRFALVVGDPPQNYGRLPGARAEAKSIADLVESRDWRVTRCIYDSGDTADDAWTEILDALYQHPYRLIHIAAHGIIDADERSSGVVIGSDAHERLTALDFEKMTVTPDMVFLNCCHLGRIDTPLGGSVPDELRQPHRLAATVARQLLRNGVSAVIVAGWAVDDVAAAAFADVLYQTMLDGYHFGEAVRRARLAAHEADGGRSNTWGAYQCYGDPNFELGMDQPSRPSTWSVVSSRQLARELDVLAANGGTSTSAAHRASVADEIDHLRVAGSRLLDDGIALAALGRALAEVGNYPEAAATYEAALQHPAGGADVAAIEQLANVRARLASQQFRAGTQYYDGPGGLLDDALVALDRLVEVAGPTAERCALRGGIFKRRATMLDEAARTAALEAAREAYTKAWQLSSAAHGARLNSYHTNLRLQTSALVRPGCTLDDDEPALLDRLWTEVTEALEARPSDYWNAAALADTRVTYALVGQGVGSMAVSLKDAGEEYVAAFKLRSTVGQRDSVVSHLSDLVDLLGNERGEEFQLLVKALQKAD